MFCGGGDSLYSKSRTSCGLLKTGIFLIFDCVSPSNAKLHRKEKFNKHLQFWETITHHLHYFEANKLLGAQHIFMLMLMRYIRVVED